MAEGKKSFLLYTNYIDLLDGYDEDGEHIEGMTDEEAGKWIKTIFRYVNDLNPSIPNEIKQAFILVRKDLKQDLKKYENKVKSIENARKHNENNMKSSSNQTENKLKTDSNQTEISSVNVNDNVNVNVNDNDIVCDKSHTNNACACEEENIEALQNFLTEIETMMNKVITGKNCDIACKMYEKYGKDKTLYEIKNNLDKNNPILYAYKVLESEKVKKGYDDDLLLEDEWLKEFNERTRQDEEQRKKELRNED